MHRGTRFFIKADWDSWIHTTRLEVNLRALLGQRTGPLYFGNTLWCSYSVEDFQPCGYGFGPLQVRSPLPFRSLPFHSLPFHSLLSPRSRPLMAPSAC